MKRPAFTLIELLVVIAIITLLLAISAPVLCSLRIQTRVVLCSSNVRQLLFGLLTYGAENETLPYGFINNPLSLPPPGGYPGNPAFDRKGFWWFNYISDYTRKSQGKWSVLQCPSRPTMDAKFDLVLCGNFGVNRSICKSYDDRQPFREEFVGVPLSTDSITKPAETLLILDSGYSLISWWHATSEPPVTLNIKIIEDTSYVPGLSINKKRSFWPGQEDDAIEGRHPKKTVNVGFVDGHLKALEAESLLVEKEGKVYKNKSPLWQPK